MIGLASSIRKKFEIEISIWWKKKKTKLKLLAHELLQLWMRIMIVTKRKIQINCSIILIIFVQYFDWPLVFVFAVFGIETNSIYFEFRLSNCAGREWERERRFINYPHSFDCKKKKTVRKSPSHKKINLPILSGVQLNSIYVLNVSKSISIFAEIFQRRMFFIFRHSIVGHSNLLCRKNFAVKLWLRANM